MAEKVIFELTLDTSKLNATAKAAAKELEVLTDQQAELRKEGKKNTVQYQELTNEITRNRKILRDSTRALADNSRVSKDNSQSIINLRDRLRLATAARNGLSRADRDGTARGKALSKTVKDLTTELKKQESAVGDNRRNVGGYAEALRKGAINVKNFIVQSIGLIAIMGAVLKAFKSAIDITIKFEKEMSTLQSITGATTEEMEFYSEAALEIGEVTKTSATEVVRAFTEIGSAQPELLKSRDALAEVTKQALILAKAGGIDTVVAAKALTSAMNQFGVSADKAAKFTDIFATSQQKGSSFIEATSEALKNSGAAANAAGLSFETTNAAIQALAKGALVGAEAGTSLRGILIKLSSQTDKTINPSMVGLSETIEVLAQRNLTLAEATKLVGQEGATGLLTLIAQRDIFNELDGSLNEVGNAQEQMRINTDNLDGALDDLNNRWEAFILSLGTGNSGLGRVINTLVRFASSILDTATATNEAKESTLDLFKENTKGIIQAQSLVNEFKNLSAQEKLNESDTRRLSNVTAQLARQFGDSVIEIDRETGALKLNIEEVVRQISIRQALQSEEVQSLVATRLRLTTQLSAIEREKEFIEVIRARTDISFEARQALDAEAFSIGAKTQQEADAAAAIGNLSLEQQQLIKAINESKTVINQEIFAKTELDQINKALLDSGIDLTAIALKETEQIKKRTTADVESNKERKKRLKTEEQLRASALKLQRLLTDAEIANIADREIRLTAIEDERFKRLQEDLEREFEGKEELKRLLVELEQQHVRNIEKINEDSAQRLLDADLKDIERQQLQKDKESQEADEADAIKTANQQLAKETALNVAQDVSNALFENANRNRAREFDADLAVVNDKADSAKLALDNQLANSLISQEEFNNQVKQLADKREIEEEQLRRRAFNDQKKQDLLQAAINGALAVVKAIALFGPPPSPAGIAGIISAVATTAIQTAFISGRKFAKGGISSQHIAGGRDHTQGGTNYVGEDGHTFNVQRGELITIVNRKSTDTIRGLSSLNQMNGNGVPFGGGGIASLGFKSLKFQDGGFANRQASDPSDQTERLAELLAEKIADITIVTSIEDIVDANDRRNRIRQRRLV